MPLKALVIIPLTVVTISRLGTVYISRGYK